MLSIQQSLLLTIHYMSLLGAVGGVIGFCICLLTRQKPRHMLTVAVVCGILMLVTISEKSHFAQYLPAITHALTIGSES